MLEGLEEVDWQGFPGPEWYDPASVAPAIRALAVDESGDYSVASAVLYAIGNDCGGELYPAAVASVPFLLDIALTAPSMTARGQALGVLTDMLYFQAVPPFDVVAQQDGRQVSVEQGVAAVLEARRDDLATLAKSRSRWSAAAEGILGLLDERRDEGHV